MNHQDWIWPIAALAVGGMIARPWRTPEALWAALGAVLVTVTGLLSWAGAWRGVLAGGDVYLFLTGMMLLSETARREGLFDWAARGALALAGGSRGRLFALTYAIGVAVTAILSNDATAVILTPAVLAMTRAAKVPAAPFLFACALVANAASFVLPISNPANLVVFAGRPPELLAWLTRFAAPSAAAILVTGLVLAVAHRRALRGDAAAAGASAPLGPGGWTALAGLLLTAAGLLGASSLGWSLGPPTFILGTATTGIVLARGRGAPWPLLARVNWSVLPLVAALFVLAAAVERSHATIDAAGLLGRLAARAQDAAAVLAGISAAILDNLANNLPVGLLARGTLHAAKASPRVTDAVLIGVDLGPNLSVSGSLATILWLAVLRREGEEMSFRRFLKIGALAMPPALAAALAVRLLLA